MSIRALLSAKASVEFTLDGETHSVSLRSPTAEEARELRAEFYRLGSQVSSASDGAASPQAVDEFESCIARAVKSCFVPGSEDAQMTDDEVRLFLLRIGGDKSEVVRTALRWCGIQYDAAGIDAGEGEAADSAF